jgi:hypothetical protein
MGITVRFMEPVPESSVTQVEPEIHELSLTRTPTAKVAIRENPR